MNTTVLQAPAETKLQLRHKNLVESIASFPNLDVCELDF